MAKSPELDRVIESYRVRAEARLTAQRWCVDDDRASYERATAEFPLDKDVKCDRISAGGVTAEWVCAPGADVSRTLLYLHGGGYVIGSCRTHRAMMARMSAAAKVRVLALDYRLAPEHVFPAPVEDSVAAYRWLLSTGADPRKIVVGGESAGGALVVSLFVVLRYLGEPLPAAGISISPWADLEQSGDTMSSNAEVDPSVNRERLEWFAGCYLGGKDPRAPLASPIYADMTGLPPLLIMAGSVEVLVDDARRLAANGEKSGVNTTLEIWEDMPHNWPMYAHILPEAQQSIDRIGDFIGQHIA